MAARGLKVANFSLIESGQDHEGEPAAEIIHVWVLVKRGLARRITEGINWISTDLVRIPKWAGVPGSEIPRPSPEIHPCLSHAIILWYDQDHEGEPAAERLSMLGLSKAWP